MATDASAARWNTTSQPATAFANNLRISDAPANQFRRRVDVREILRKPGREIVEDTHRMPGRRECFREVRADEPGPAGDEIRHK